jgi:hypothetical protein
MNDNELPSLLSCVRPDGSINLTAALRRSTMEDRDEEILWGETSLLECFDSSGNFNMSKFLQRQEEVSLFEMTLLYEADIIDNSNTVVEKKMKKPYQPRNSRSMLYEVWKGNERVAAKPEDSTWYLMYIKYPMLNVPKFHIQFRRRFRLPYDQFIQFVAHAEEKKWFPRWNKWNSTSPLALLVLGAFRYIGRGWTFDDLEESTLISAEVHRNFLHQFLYIGSTILYALYVAAPNSVEELQSHEREFAMAGFTGCIGSTDATHIAIEKCSYRLRNNHLGSKQHLTTRTFNLTVNHRRRILSTTIGMPGRWNDKTVVLFDEFVSGIYEGLYYPSLLLLFYFFILTSTTFFTNR